MLRVYVHKILKIRYEGLKDKFEKTSQTEDQKNQIKGNKRLRDIWIVNLKISNVP